MPLIKIRIILTLNNYDYITLKLFIMKKISILFTVFFAFIGLGNLSSQNFYEQGKIARTINIGYHANPAFSDIDNDGDMDLVVGNLDGIVMVYYQVANNIFSMGDTLKADGNNIDMTNDANPDFVDIDNDGDMDLAIGWGRITIFLNDGSGNFTNGGNLQADGSDIMIYYTPEFADYDGDGDEDLFAAGYDGTIAVFTNDGNNNFSAAGNLQADGTDIDVGDWATPTFADLDNDGDLDLYAGSYLGTISVFTNNGDGTFSASGQLQANGQVISTGTNSFPEFYDLNNDGNLDLFIGNEAGNIYIFNNTGAGNFVSNGTFTYDMGKITVLGNSSPALADLDNDGDMDIYVGSEYGKIAIYENLGNNVFHYTGNLKADGSQINVPYAKPCFTDFNNDGNIDLLVGDGDGTIHIFLNNGSNSFLSSGLVQTDGTTLDVGYRAAPATADLDNDGDLDLYVGNSDGYVTEYIYDGSQYTETGNLNNVDVGVDASPYFTDIDNDLDLDLLCGSSLDTMYFYENQGGGNFIASSNFISTWECSPVTFDWDNDGDFDILSGNDEGYLWVFYNNAGNFSGTESQIIYTYDNNLLQTNNYFTCPRLADLDNDGDLDLYISGRNYSYSSTICEFLNDSNGNFTYHQRLKDNSGYYIENIDFLSFIDWDNDGDLDFIASSPSGHIDLYINNSGTFTFDSDLQADGNTIDFYYTYSMFFTFASDWDNDGDIDLFVGTLAGNIICFINDGTGNFSNAGNLQADGTDINIQSNFVAPAFADLDNDGDKDLYCGDNNGNIQVYENTGSNNYTYSGTLQLFNGNDINVQGFAIPEFADFDNDGDQDLLVGACTGDVYLYSNSTSVNIKQPLSDLLNISVYPNPTTNTVKLTGVKNYSADILDINGKKVLSFPKSQKNTMTLNLKPLTSGIYFIRFTSNDGYNITKKIILE